MARRVTYVALPTEGTGKATPMHARRGPALSRHVGVPLAPGTLNVRLDRPFDWAGAADVAVPDAVDWSDLEGRWFVSSALVKAVTVGGVRAWAVRMSRSRASPRLVELVAGVKLRDAVGEWPAELEA